jgi:hypothetical protein
MIPLAPKHALVALLTAAAAVRGYPLPSRQAESIIERGLSDSVGHLIDKVKSGVGNVVHGAGELLGIGSGGPNHTPTVPITKDVFAELSKGALYSNAAYCSAGAVKSWSCGATCDALGDVKVAFTGGDNKKVPACKWEFRLPKNYIYSYFPIQFSLRSTRRFKALWSLLRVLSQPN